MSGPVEMKGSSGNPILATADPEEQKTVLGAQLKRKSWASRNPWLIVGASLLVVAVVVIGMSVGLTQSSGRKSNSAVEQNTTSAPQASPDEVYQLPSPDTYNLAEWQGLSVDYYKQLNDSAYLTPENIKKFVEEARHTMRNKFNVTLSEHLGSAKTILQYLQVSQQWEILDTIVNWAAGRNLTTLKFDDLMALAKKLQTTFSINAMHEFNKGQSIAHEYVVGKSKAEGLPMTWQELLKGLQELGFDMNDDENATTIEDPQKDATGSSHQLKRREAPPSSETTNSARKLSLPPPPPSPSPKPASSTPKAKFSFPSLTIPLVFHFMQYTSITKEGKKVALPPTYDSAKAAQQITTEVNKIFKAYNTNIQYRLGEVRTDVKNYPYLLLKDLNEWQNVAAEGIQSKGISWVSNNNAAVDQYINVYIAGSFAIPQAPCAVPGGVECGRGYAWVIPIGTCATTEKQGWQHVFIMHDEINLAWYNKDWGGYYPGAIVLAHELGHHLGLQHTHSGLNTFPYGCSNPNDNVGDTPENEDAQKQAWWDEADSTCQDFLGGKAINWDNQMKKFDSCPKAEGYDAIFNVMSYSPDSCRASRHMALTRGQVKYMHGKITMCRPKLLACASGAKANCYKD